MKCTLIFLNLLFAGLLCQSQILRNPIPDKLVVLSFDDGPASHATTVGPLLKKYKFGATFFVCEFPPDFDDKTKYMSWPQMQQLDKMGFEVANHTHHHVNVKKMDAKLFNEELSYIEDTCKALHMKIPIVSFAYPGYTTDSAAIPVLKSRGYQFARTGGNRAYDPLTDHPFLIPSFTMTDTNKAEILAALPLAKEGKVVVITVHGVPDLPHPWVTTSLKVFEDHLKYLKANNYRVISMRELAQYINPVEAMTDITPKF